MKKPFPFDMPGSGKIKIAVKVADKNTGSSTKKSAKSASKKSNLPPVIKNRLA